MEAAINSVTTAFAATYEEPADERALRQLSLKGVIAVWAAAALPMGLLAWVVSPLLADQLSGPNALVRALLITLTGGLIWQFVLVMTLVRREQGTLRLPVLRDALWLRAPRSPRTGRRGGRVWLILLPLTLVFGAEELIPALLAFNTVLGEELLFRGYLLPRMNGAFGRRDWLANGVLFAVYHLHEPWVIPAPLLVPVEAFAAKRYRSALVSIAVHSVQTVFVLAIVLSLTLKG
jgi:membrane protease YdiL (CAAX protease family)